MSRYLTPSKVALLALTSLYCESVVPNDSVIPVLSFLVSKLLPNYRINDGSGSPNSSPDLDVAIQDFERIAGSHVSSVPGRSLLDLFLDKLWKIDSLDALHEFFDNLEEILVRDPTEEREEMDQPPPNRMQLSRTSPLGVFVRRARVEFSRLRFQDAILLWTAFVKYKEPSMVAWRKKNPTASRTSFDANIQSIDLQANSELLDVAYGRLTDNLEPDETISTSDIEVLLEFQINKLQSMCSKNFGLAPLTMAKSIGQEFPRT